jgi:hypothetical protein
MLILGFTRRAQVEIWTSQALESHTFDWLHAAAVTGYAVMDIPSNGGFEFQKSVRGRMKIFLFARRAEIEIGTDSALVSVS